MSPTSASPVVERRRYACPRLPGRDGCGRMSVMASYIEEAALQAVLARVASPDISVRPVRASARDRRWLKAAEELDRTQRLLDSLAKDLGNGRLSRREWLFIRPQLADRLEKAKAIVMQDRYDAAIKEFIGNPLPLAAAWPQMAASRRRTVLRGLIDHIVVRPAVIGQRRFDPTRLIAHWRGDGPFPQPRRMQAPARQHCSVVGCRRLLKSRGLCPDALCTLAKDGKRRRRKACCEPLVPRQNMKGHWVPG